MLTGMIWYRLVCHAKTVEEHHGNEHASSYFSIDALVVESMLPYTLFGLAFLNLVSCGVEHSDGSGAEVAFHLRCHPVYTFQSTSQVISNCAKETLHSTSDKILVHILLGGIGV